MDQKQTVDALMKDILQFRPMCNELKEIVRHYLEMSYAVGYDEGKRQIAHGKPVAQMQEGKVIKIWPSQWDAEKHFNLTKGALHKALHFNKHGKKYKIAGFEWEAIKNPGAITAAGF